MSQAWWRLQISSTLSIYIRQRNRPTCVCDRALEAVEGVATDETVFVGEGICVSADISWVSRSSVVVFALFLSRSEVYLKLAGTTKGPKS